MSNWESWGSAAVDLNGSETLPCNHNGVKAYFTINKIVAFLGTAFEAAGAVATAIASHLSAYVHSDIAHTNRVALDQVSGTNTGDQDISGMMLASAIEVGTWDPVCMLGATEVGGYVSRRGNYTRIKNRVFFDLQVNISTKGLGTGIPSISLPIVAKSDTASDTWARIFPIVGLTTSSIGATVVGFANAISLTSQEYDHVTGATYLSDANLTNTTSINISGSYVADGY